MTAIPSASPSPGAKPAGTVREERDDQVVRDVNYTDWHRVERAIQLFELASQDVASPRA